MTAPANPREGARPPLTLVLLNKAPGAEWDWIQHLLSHFEVDVITDPDAGTLRPGALYTYYNDKKIDLPETFLKGVADLKGCGFLHCGDEYFRADMRVYAAFDYVIRGPWTDLLAGPGVMGIPIGPSNNMPARDLIPPSRRGLAWSFAGGRRLSRMNMARIFAGITPNSVSLPDLTRGETHISRSAYLDAVADSAFIPCVEGNVIIETLRPYEALAYGAIPILPRRLFADPYRSILGADHPLPTFRTWTEASAFVCRMMADKAALDRLQGEVMAWWRGKLDAYPQHVADFIRKGMAGEMREPLRARFRTWGGSGWQLRRMWELTRQQSGGQVRERLERLPRKIVARLQGQSTDGVWALSTHSQTGTGAPSSANQPGSGQSSSGPDKPRS
jgi:hypothetical protein